MANIFDSTNWPEYPPDPFIAGDYFAFKKTGMTGEFPIAPYAVTFNASLFGSSTETTSASQIAITATESGSEYQITKNASDTASWTVGDYAWNLFVTDSSDSNKRQQLDYGTFEIKANWATSTADPRSDAQKNLELIEDILYNRVQSDIRSHSKGERQLLKIPLSDLIEFIYFFKWQIVVEERKERIHRDKGTGA